MIIDLTRKIPKLNSMYRITKKDSESSINCRINFNIIDFIYTYIIRKNNSNKTLHYDKLYEFLDVKETYYENYRNGKKIEAIEHDRAFRHVKINKLVNGEDRLEIVGVSAKQWKRYFWICEKYAQLKKEGADVKYIKEAKHRKDAFQELVFSKIDNMEMNESACNIYRKLTKHLFENELSKRYRQEGDEWLTALAGISKSSLEGLWKADRQKYNEICRTLCNVYKQMKEVKEQNSGK